MGIISKVHPIRSHSNAAQGGINAALAVDDSWESHAFDTIKGSDYLSDQDAVEIMCREAPNELLHLEHIGVTFHRNEKGELGTRAFGGASHARTYYVADITGQAIMHTLYEQLMKYADLIDRYEEWFTTELALDEDGNCVGAVTRNIKDGSMELFRAKAVILASGGNGQIWHPTTNALICTGDGIAMAYRAGAKLMDMEMIQYHPTTLRGKGFLITEGARGEGAHLLNAKGERFMEKYAPNKMELASRDVVSRAEQTEINEGRGFPDGTVALDITVEYSKDRVQFDKPLGAFQALSHYMADATTAIDGAEGLVWEAAWAASAGRPEAVKLAPMAKLFACDTFRDTTAMAQQIFGGVGFTLEYDIQLYFRRAKQLQLSWGDAPYLEALIATEVLDAPAA